MLKSLSGAAGALILGTTLLLYLLWGRREVREP